MELYEYQQKAVNKLTRNPEVYPHVLIGDDMGLGKTVTAIALDRVRRLTPRTDAQDGWFGDSRRMTLIITLKSTVSVWEDHLKVWAAGAKVVSITDYSRGQLVELALGQKADFFIVNWDILRLEPKLSNVRWLHKISDEVQKAKNRKAQVTVAWKRIKALYKTDMSGTWADNSPGDAWSILNHLYPNKWPGYNQFYNHHVLHEQKINHRTGAVYKVVTGVADEEGLHRKMAPFYVRRTKDQVLPDLPPKVYSTIRVRLSPQQRRAYDDMRLDMLAWVGQHENEPLAAPVVITKLLRLQQLAVSYGRTEWYKRKVKDPETEEVTEEDAVRLVLTDPSAKLDALMDFLDQLPHDESLVVFAQSKQIIHRFGDRLQKAGISHGLLTGDTKDRGELIANFQAKKFRVLAGTIKAGGIGITLTAANKMVFIDRDWSPSQNRQAEDRIHRIGQTETCFYYDMVADDTIDMGRLQQIQTKWEWLKKILGGK